MPLWTDSQLQSWLQEGEKAIAVSRNIILDRFSLALFPGQSEYVIPDWMTNISRVTIQGFQVDPVDFGQVVNSLSSPRNVIGSARPLNYAYSGFGTKVIKFYPSAGTGMQIVEGDLWNQTAISSGLIVEGYREPDPTDNLKRIPDYIRPILNKYYVLQRALAQDGPGQDLMGARQFENLLELSVKALVELNSAKFISRENILSDSMNEGCKPWVARPMLPPNYPQGGGYGR